MTWFWCLDRNVFYGCVLHIKPFFLLGYIEYTQCPSWFVTLESYKPCGYKTTTQAVTEMIGFCVWIEIVFEPGHLNWFDIRVGIEIDLMSVLRSKLTFFLCGGSKLTWFYYGDRNWLGLDAGGRNWFGFCVRAENDLFLAWVTWLSYGWSKRTCFLCAVCGRQGTSVVHPRVSDGDMDLRV